VHRSKKKKTETIFWCRSTHNNNFSSLLKQVTFVSSSRACSRIKVHLESRFKCTIGQRLAVKIRAPMRTAPRIARTISNDNDRRNCNSLLQCATSRGLQRVHTRVTQSDWPSASGKLVLHNCNIIVLYLFRVNKYIESIVKYYKMYGFHYLMLLN